MTVTDDGLSPEARRLELRDRLCVDGGMLIHWARLDRTGHGGEPSANSPPAHSRFTPSQVGMAGMMSEDWWTVGRQIRNASGASACNGPIHRGGTLDATNTVPGPGSRSLEVTCVVLAGLDRLGRHTADSATLCRLVGVSERSLQVAFNEVYGEPPSVVLRRRALHRARRRLQRGDAGSITVSSIALDHGFTHLGRFALYYKEQFGESPSATLRRSPELTHHP